ncbi:hypothetical protein AB4089_15010 [Arthrobacter sp. 2MCAF15]|uniref:hypothetical protein n=1 Tax=Arthrobacter sp. 2MCAF15 TaxID=3232984 RepID=UPI003F917FB9
MIARPSKFYPARPLALAVIAAASLLNASAGNAADSTAWTASAYRGSVNVVEGLTSASRGSTASASSA